MCSVAVVNVLVGLGLMVDLGCWLLLKICMFVDWVGTGATLCHFFGLRLCAYTLDFLVCGFAVFKFSIGVDIRWFLYSCLGFVVRWGFTFHSFVV